MTTKNRARKIAPNSRPVCGTELRSYSSNSSLASLVRIKKEYVSGEAVELSRFLELLWSHSASDSANLIPYTQELDAELDELLDGVEID